LEKENLDFVKASVDLSRANNNIRNPVVTAQFKNIFSIGKETDLLETIRRADNPERDVFKLSKDELELRSARVGIDPTLLELSVIPSFIENNLIEDLGNEYEIKFQSIENVYDYGISRIESGLSEKEKSVIKVIAAGMKKPVIENTFDESLQNFPEYSLQSIKRYLDSAKILTPLSAKDAIYYTSPKIFKNRKRFDEILEVTEGSIIADVLDNVSSIPGIPSDTMRFNQGLISGLAVSGAIEPINLNINGVSKNYLFAPAIMLENNEKDHLDLVKKTLSNFRYGERYSKWNLFNVTSFLESLLDKGFAGKATPIGTDYRNLEDSGIVKVEKITGDQYGRYRFWLLKRDVVEDVLNIIKGNIPFDPLEANANLSKIDDSVSSRISLSNDSSYYIKEFTDAIRKINGVFDPW
jgi:hypothetical protein